MLQGHVDKVSHEEIGGWAADSEAAARAVPICILVDGEVHVTLQCRRYRPDLASIGSYGDGRHGFRFNFSPPLDPKSRPTIQVVYEESGATLPNGVWKLAESPVKSELTPILITAIGRSGTTLLMSRLGNSPKIVMGDAPPFELRLLAYYSVAQRVLTRSDNLNNSANPDRLEAEILRLGYNPYFSDSYARQLGGEQKVRQFIDSYVRGQLNSLFKEIIGKYYRGVAEWQQKHDVIYFAEKSNNLERGMREFSRSIYEGLREIIIVRDPRDLICSHISYFTSDRSKALSDIAGMTAEILRISRNLPHNTLIMKYEDLVLRPEESDSQIADFLGIDLIGRRSPEAEAKIFRGHGTSTSPNASIGRWRSQLEMSDQLHNNRIWTDFLSRFGYELE